MIPKRKAKRTFEKVVGPKPKPKKKVVAKKPKVVSVKKTKPKQERYKEIVYKQKVFKKNVAKEDMLKALEQSLGLISIACDRCEIAYNTHYRWLRNDPQYAERVAEIEDRALDVAESMLHANILKGNVPSIIFYLKTKGKKRGFIERQETVEMKDDTPDLSKLTNEDLVKLVTNDN